MPLILKANLDAKRTGVYDGRAYAILQTIERNEDGSIKLIEVNLPDGFDHSVYVEGQQIEVPVTVRAKDSKVYYRAVLPNTDSKR